MQVKSIVECSNSAILSTFIKLPFAIKIFVLSIFEWPFYTGFTVFNEQVLLYFTEMLHVWLSTKVGESHFDMSKTWNLGRVANCC